MSGNNLSAPTGSDSVGFLTLESDCYRDRYALSVLKP